LIIQLGFPLKYICFSIQPDFDQEYVLSSLSFAQSLMNYKTEISYLEIKTNPAVNSDKTVAAIGALDGGYG